MPCRPSISLSSAATSRWKAPTPCDPASVVTISSFYQFNSCRRSRNITHLTIFASSDPSSPSCSSSLDSHITQLTTSSSRQKLRKRTLHSAKSSGERIEIQVHGKASVTVTPKIVAIRSKSVGKRQPFWTKNLFGSKKIRSIILLNVITILYASNIPVVKEVEAIIDPAAFSAVRFTLSAIPFLPFVFRARNDVQTRNAGMELGLWVSLGYLMEALGLLTSDAGRASFISLFTVIVVPLLESILGEIVPPRTWFGVLMSVIGVAMLECSGSPPSVGDLLNFLSAICFGIHTLRTEHISRSTKEENFLPLLGYEVCVIALSSTIWYLSGGCLDGLEEVSWTMLWDWIVGFPWIPAVYTGLFSTGLCLWAEIAAMREVTATETAVIYGLEPLWGAGFAWFLLGERWGVAGWIGAALVLGGSLTVQIFGSSPQKSGEVGPKCNEDDILMASETQKRRTSLSTSPVIVSSRKDVIDILKK